MITLLLGFLRDLLRPSRDLLIENLALRQQILVLERTNPRPPFNDLDRCPYSKLHPCAIASFT